MNAKYVILVVVALFSLTAAQPPVETAVETVLENERLAKEYGREALRIVENTDDCACSYQLEAVADVTADDDGSLHFQIRIRSEEFVDNMLAVKQEFCNVDVTVDGADMSQTIAVMPCTVAE